MSPGHREAKHITSYAENVLHPVPGNVVMRVHGYLNSREMCKLPGLSKLVKNFY